MKPRKIVISSAILAILIINAQVASAACNEMSAVDAQHLREAIEANGPTDTESVPFIVGKSADTESYPLYTENSLKQLDKANKNNHSHYSPCFCCL